MRLGTLLLVTTLATTAFADPRMWEPQGRMIRGEGPVSIGGSATNEDDLTLVVWIDYETGHGDLWGQLLDFNGNPLWETQGRRFMATPERESGISVHAWQEGFLLCFSRPNQYMNGQDLFMLAIDLEGNAVWQQNNGTGIRVSDETTYTGVLHDINIRSGGHILFAYGSWDVYFERFVLYINGIQSDGEMLWHEPLVILEDGNLGTMWGIDCDGEGNWYLARSRYVDVSEEMYYVAKFTFAGILAWEHAYHFGQGHNEALTLQYVEGEGCYVAWGNDSLQSQALKMQCYAEDGTTVWPAPVVVDSDWSEGYSLRLLPNISGNQNTGVIASWIEDDNLPADSGGIRVQKISAAGTCMWEDDGVQLCTRSHYNATPAFKATSDYSGGVVALMELYAPNEHWYHYEIRINRISGAGLPMWGNSCGTVLTSIEEDVYQAEIAVGNPNHVACSWYTHVDTNTIKTTLHDLETGERLPPVEGRVWTGGLAGTVNDVNAVSLPGNRAAVIWRDTRYQPNYYYQFVNSTGDAELEPNGVPVFQNSSGGNTSLYETCEDGSGGFYIVHSWESGDFGYLQAAHIGADGNRVAEIMLDEIVTDYPDIIPACVTSTNGRFYALWQVRILGFGYQTKIMLLDSLLESEWALPLLLASGSTASLRAASAMPDGDCVVLWAPENETRSVSRIHQDRSIIWTTEINNSAERFASGEAIVVNSEGMIYAAWLDARPDGITSDIYGQKLTSSGVPQLTHNGVLMGTNADDLMLEPLTLLYDNGLWLLYSKELPGIDNALFANKFNESLERLLGEDGMPINTGQRLVFRHSTVVDGAGGIIAAYGFEPEFGESVARAIHLDENGVITDTYWADGGIICDTTHGQYGPVIARGTNSDQFFCFWEDTRSYQQVFGQYIDESFSSVKPPEAPIVTGITLSQNYPNPFNANTEIVFSLPRATNAKLRVYDVTGRLVRTLADERFMAGEHRIAFDATGIASGIYFYELQTTDAKVARKMLLLK